jgi:L-alanine-DL-glutamate epimerase-like enolase superfamily enzyme
VRAFYKGWYNELVTAMPVIKDGYVYPMEGPGLGVDLLSSVFDRSDLVARRSHV